VALGAAVSAARPIIVGIAGLLAAPAAFVTAKAVQKSTAHAVGVVPPEDLSALIFGAIVMLRALEYAALGVSLAWLARRSHTSVWRFIAAGAIVGLVFGSAALCVLYFSAVARMPAPKIASAAINEIFFPVCCSLVLFAAKCLGERLQPARVEKT
jgi:hypothetical protein